VNRKPRRDEDQDSLVTVYGSRFTIFYSHLAQRARRVAPVLFTGQSDGGDEAGSQIDDLARCSVGLLHGIRLCEQVAKVKLCFTGHSAILLLNKVRRTVRFALAVRNVGPELRWI